MLVSWAAARRSCARRSWRSFAAPALLPLTLALGACEAGDGYPQTTFRPVSEFGDILNDVFYNTFGWTMGILVLVIALILFAAYRFRERPDTPHPEQIHGNTRLEIAWTIVPAIIVVLMGVPTVKAIFSTQEEPPAGALEVDVIGHQWWWEFRYPQYDVVTANDLVLPVGRPVSLRMHSVDVIHSFWIPKIGGKRDVNPLPARPEGVEPKHKNYLLFTVRDEGEYLGQCAEYCGESHAIMRTFTSAVSPEAFDQWVARMKGQVATAPVTAPGSGVPAGVPAGASPDTIAAPVDGQPAALTATPAAQSTIGQMPVPTGAGNPFRAPMSDSIMIAEGQRIFLASACIACHAVANTTAVGAVGPNLTMLGARKSLGAGAIDMSMENLVAWIREPQAIKPGTLMPGTRSGAAGFAATGLTDTEVRAVAAYLISLK